MSKNTAAQRSSRHYIARSTLVAASCVLVLNGCAQTDQKPAPTTVVTVTSTEANSSTSQTPVSPDLAGLRRSLAAAIAKLPGSVTVTVAAVGNSTSVDLAKPSNDVAWSTIKVPLVVAAQRANVPSADALSQRAIVDSDNAAAEQLFAQLGAPEAAARKVDAVLADAGDPDTRVQSERIRPGFTAFGQTRWTGLAQARFAAGLPCVDGGSDVLALMKRVSGTQQWGLASLPNAAVKGGWGPDTNGRYLVRQLAVVPTSNGSVAFALSARPSSGQQADGNAMLSSVAAWVRTNLPKFPSGRCG